MSDFSKSELDTEIVSIIILGYNGREYLLNCLSSVFDQTFHPKWYEVIYADNGSSDGSADWVSQNFPSVKVLRFDRNLGFCEGNNRAVQWAKGHYLVFLNQDMVVHRYWLAELVAVFRNSSQIKAAHSTGKLLRSDDLERHDMLERVLYSEVSRYGTIEHTEISSQSGPIRTLHVGGGAMIIDRSVIDALDYIFDPRLFAYAEDLDLGLRLSALGYQAVCVPTAIAYHDIEGRDRISKKTIWRASMATRNRFLVFMKNMYIEEFLLALPLFLYGSVAKMQSLVRHPVKRWLYALALIPFTIYHLASAILRLPWFLRDRRKILASRSQRYSRHWLLNELYLKGRAES